MTRPVSDVLSLTLPAKVGQRVRSRRRQKPPAWFWFYVAMTVVFAGLAVWAFLTRGYVIVGLDTCGVVLHWNYARLVKAGRPTLVLVPAHYAWLAAMFTAAVVGLR